MQFADARDVGQERKPRMKVDTKFFALSNWKNGTAFSRYWGNCRRSGLWGNIESLGLDVNVIKWPMEDIDFLSMWT